jgi:hypothetical protein
MFLVASLVASANTGSSDDEDSVQSWGQWAQNFTTAAGGEINTGALGLAFSGVGQGETGRNGQNEPGFEVPSDIDVALCEAGAICGFVTIKQPRKPQLSEPEFLIIGEQEGPSLQDKSKASQVPKFAISDVGLFAADVQASEVPDVQASEVPEGRLRKGKSQKVNIDGSFSVQGNEGYELTVEDATGSFSRKRAQLSKFDDNTYAQVRFPKISSRLGIAKGTWSTETWFIDERSIDTESLFGFDNANGAVWAGITTSMDQLDDYIGSHGVVASYRGKTMDGGRFTASIDFGNQTWNGAWNRGDVRGDRNIQTSATNVVGKVAFAVTNGAVNGINFMANSSNLSAVDGEVTGTVQGAIFGSNAQSVIGMVDIVKTTENYTSLQHETLFSGVNAITSPAGPE